MTINTLMLGFGAVLLFVGILGGGFELKEFKVPKVGPFARILASVIGCVFILVGIGLGAGLQANPPHNSPAKPIDFTITDQLGTGQITEQVTILIDGKFAGQLTVDARNPQTTISVNLPSAGLHSYTVESTTLVEGHGASQEYRGAGQGMIDVEAGKQFDVEGSVSGDTWFVTLAEASRTGTTAAR
jgi:hypothetical protein